MPLLPGLETEGRAPKTDRTHNEGGVPCRGLAQTFGEATLSPVGTAEMLQSWAMQQAGRDAAQLTVEAALNGWG